MHFWGFPFCMEIDKSLKYIQIRDREIAFLSFPAHASKVKSRKPAHSSSTKVGMQKKMQPQLEDAQRRALK